jgi:hypothetical protein
MEPNGSLPCSQEFVTGPCPQRDQSVHFSPSILILTSHLHLGLPSSPVPSGFPTKIRVYIPLLFHVCHMPWLSHPPLFDRSNDNWRRVHVLYSPPLCSFLKALIILSLFGPNISLSTLFRSTLSLCSSLNIRDQVSHPYRTTGKIKVLYILIFAF